MDMAGNPVEAPFSWTFGVLDQPCGTAEFYSLDSKRITNPGYVVNAMTPLIDGALSVMAYNPQHGELSWLQNTRIEHIDLLYRKISSLSWQPALDINGNAAEFFDDVGVVVPCTVNKNAASLIGSFFFSNH
jgi:hypothetical protein